MEKVLVNAGDRIRCKRCGQLHVLEQGKHYVTKKLLDNILVYRCDRRKLIGALDGYLIGQLAKQKGRRLWRKKMKSISHS